jgi:glycosyltransferase involved in cell wall biosynthesis/2-polyprenyl-3-methyl-5-hydroxy-6-metoxy-1,4-benzoquinol methylase
MARDQAMSVLMCGTFDPNFGRNRQLLRLLKSRNITVNIKNFSLWSSNKVADVRQGKVQRALRAVAVYGQMIIVLLGQTLNPRRRPSIVLVPHPCQFDAVVVGVVCRIVRVPMVIDYFVSLHETVVDDRNIVSSTSLTAKVLRSVDALSVKLATLVLADTPEDIEAFAKETATPPSKWRTVWVGADSNIYKPTHIAPSLEKVVLFYGTYIPLQGIDFIVRASLLLPKEYRVRLIGDGQERPRIEKIIRELGAPVELLDSVSEAELPAKIAQASVCLGIFGTGAKSSRVIPNKVFQCMAMGKAVITADTPAIRSHVGSAVATVPAGEPQALANAVVALLKDDVRLRELETEGRNLFLEKFDDNKIAPMLIEALQVASGKVPMPREAPLSVMAHLQLPLVQRELLLLQPKSILEVGIGRGAFATRLAPWGRYVGVEVDPADGAVAATRLSPFPGAEFRMGGIEQVQPYETFDLVCAFEALENTQDQIATLRSWAKHVNEHGSLIISISARLRRFERQEIKKLLAAGDLEEVSIQPYGALGGHVMEFVSAKILNRWVPAIQLNSLVAAKLLAAVAVPLKLLQRPFLHTSVGVGWVVVARRKRGAL